jgi:hypothetical protein
MERAEHSLHAQDDALEQEAAGAGGGGEKSREREAGEVV